VNNRELAYEIRYEGWPYVFTHHTSLEGSQDPQMKALAREAFAECEQHVAAELEADFDTLTPEQCDDLRELAGFEKLVAVLERKTSLEYADWDDSNSGELLWDLDDSQAPALLLPDPHATAKPGRRLRPSGLAALGPSSIAE